MDILGKTVLVVISMCLSGVTIVIVTVSDVTGHWGSTDQSGTLLRVPWRTKADIGLWNTCIFRVSGFPREEVETSECVSTSESGYVSKGALRICQTSVVMTSLLSAAAVVLGLLYVIACTNKIAILIVSATVSLLSVVTSAMGVSVFVTDTGEEINMDWSFTLSVVAISSDILATCGYWYCVIRVVTDKARVNAKE